jgi:hypothetical protein
MSSTTVTRGNLRESFIISPSITPAALSAAVTTSVQTFTVPGLLTTDIVNSIGCQGAQTTGLFVSKADCLTNNILSVTFGNLLGTAITPAAGTYNFQVLRTEGPAPLNAA